jgi:hypothetical protein
MWRWIVLTGGFLFTLPAIVANIEIGLKAGKDYTFLLAGPAMVIGAAVCGVALVKALRDKAYGVSALAFTLLLSLTIMNVLNALGLASHDRAERRNVALSAQETVQRTEAELTRLQEGLLESLEASKRKPSRTVQSEIDAKKIQPFYARSGNCANVTVDDSRLQCAELFALQAQQEAAVKAEILQAKIAEVASRLQNAPVTDSVDPQAENILSVVALALPVRTDAIKETGLLVNGWWAICIELLAAFMPGLVTFLAGVGHVPDRAEIQTKPKTSRRKEVAEPKGAQPVEALPAQPDSIQQWAERIREGRGAVGFSLLSENCNAYMAEHGLPTVSDTLLGRRLAEMGFKKEKVDGKMQYVGIRLEGAKPALSVVKASGA